ncbi:hypothetical protein B0H14DRAFT_3864220 [Mycena olivaceomarginata]|nr:hypothetical protein B0H14DRAFT_3864220 [Mycena olivaceomarginata]
MSDPERVGDESTMSADIHSVPTLGTRRTREDDDQDQDRDRRHPSHRAQRSTDAEPPDDTTLVRLFTLLTRGPPLHLELEESPANAARIIAGLATVPEGLIRRLENLNALGKTDEMAGCPICQDRLIDDRVESSLRPSAAAISPESVEVTVVVLPCAHVFHAACLGPWFAKPRQTTCPLCRFDVDPMGIIWSGPHQWAVGEDPATPQEGDPPAGMANFEDFLHEDQHGEEGGEDGLELEMLMSRSSSPRSVILLLALLFSDLDPIPPPADSAHPLQRGQSNATHGAARGRAGFFFFSVDPLESANHAGDDSPLLRQDWAPPSPLGPTLRDRVERREREAGLRCCAASCCVGPSDEDPFVDVPEPMRPFVQLLSTREHEGDTQACTHMYHPECSLSAHGELEVVCSLCSTASH